ncbi:MAG: DUF1553 domain-containing protein, partial [Planctomycetaceae bacterium]|nr:DUF1553 domain-containing protein [Planctomycetaceae bacterium]
GCHGKTTGRGGFRLSLFGFHPADDHYSITRAARGRLVFPAAPSRSLLLLKPTMSVPHGGGRRLEAGDADYDRLLRWIAESMPAAAPQAAELEGIELFPSERMLKRNSTQQMVVTAVYSDGTRRDMTRLAELESTSPSHATIDRSGLVQIADRTGETALIARLQGHVATARMTIPLDAADVPPVKLPIAGFIDRHVEQKLKTLRIPPSPVCTDSQFLRRAHLLIAGRLPEPAEARDFLSSTEPDRRTRLVRQLVRSPGFADYFAQKWAGILRNKRRDQAGRVRGTIAFHRWIRNAFAENMPYDEFARRILTATGDAAVNPPAQWYAEVRYLDRYVDDTAQVFLGLRIGCARCHHHPYENYSQEDYYGLAAFFTRVGRKGGNGARERRANEVIFVSPTGQVTHPLTGAVVEPHGLGGEEQQIPAWQDPREALADWLTADDNPYFARAMVNRVWGHFFGRGLVDPRDDMRTTNPPSNGPLLDALARDFVNSGYDIRQLVETICTSTAWQLSPEPNPWNLDDTTACSRFQPQRLSAEVLLDAIDSVTGVKTPWENLPLGTRAIALPDEDYSNRLLKLYGRPERESACECERVEQPSLTQALFMMHDEFLETRIGSDSGRAAQLAGDTRDEQERIRELFLAALCREPEPAELKQAMAYLHSGQPPHAAWCDLVWVLINMQEFQHVR